MEIQAICFDADGVIVTPLRRFSTFLEEKHGITREMTQPFFHGVFNDCLTGNARLEEVLPPFLHKWGWPGSVDEFIQTWMRIADVIDTRLTDEITSLRRSGMICCLATSQEQNRADYMKTQMGFQALFDQLFISCEIGAQKPDPAYYHHIENALQIEPGSILFFDDLPVNIEGARSCGWNAEIYTDYDAFGNILNKYSLVMANH